VYFVIERLVSHPPDVAMERVRVILALNFDLVEETACCLIDKVNQTPVACPASLLSTATVDCRTT